MSFRDTKVLVAGGSGLIGSHLIQRLLNEDAHVRATYHKTPPVVKDDRVEYIQCDLTDASDCHRACKDMEYVYLCAASTSGAAAIASTPMIHVTPNVLINTLMLEAAYESRVSKFMYLGSTVAYPMSDRPVREEQMFDDDPFEKYYFAGWTKRFTEILCRMYGEKLSETMTTIVLRPTNVYGPGDDFDFATSHVAPALIRKVVERWDPIEVWGDGEDVRDLIYVDDMIEAMIAAMAKVEGHDAYNIGLGKGYSVKQMLNLILSLDGYDNATVTYDPSKPTMIPIRLVDVSKAASELDFRPTIDLEEGLRKTIQWYRSTLDA